MYHAPALAFQIADWDCIKNCRSWNVPSSSVKISLFLCLLSEIQTCAATTNCWWCEDSSGVFKLATTYKMLPSVFSFADMNKNSPSDPVAAGDQLPMSLTKWDNYCDYSCDSDSRSIPPAYSYQRSKNLCYEWHTPLLCKVWLNDDKSFIVKNSSPMKISATSFYMESWIETSFLQLPLHKPHQIHSVHIQ